MYRQSAHGLMLASAIGLTLGLAPHAVRAQKVDTVSLAPPNDVLRGHEGFTSVASIRELKDGRVLVTEPGLHRLSVVDFARSLVTAVGRRGQGPGEYEAPARLYALAGDSTILTDFVTRRWFVLLGARIVETLPATVSVPRLLGPSLSGADTTGRVVGVEGYSYTHVQVPGLSGTADSLRVYLVRRALSAGPHVIDTIGRLGGRGRFGVDIERSTVGSVRYAAIVPNRAASEDQVVLFPDGWIAFAFNDPYRVEWRQPDGRRVGGQRLPFVRVRVTEKEMCAIVRRTNPKADCARVTVPDVPEVLPPFFDNALVPTPSGDLLIRRAPSATSTFTYYDVVDRTGALRRVLRLEKNQTIIGSGLRSLYVITEDDVGLQWLTRHPWASDRPAS